MDKLKAMATFVRIIDHGSLSAAAEAQGQSPGAVVRSLAALERALQVRLLNRTTRQLALTEEGQRYLDHCRDILARIDREEAALRDDPDTPSGTVRVTAPETFGRYHLAPLVNRFLQTHPAMRIQLVLDDRPLNLVEAGLDLALRIGQLPDSSLVARRLGTMPTVLCASPDYLASSGVPDLPAALSNHACVTFAPQGPIWRFRMAGEELAVRIDPTLVTNQIDSARQACLAGLGFGRFFHYQVREALADGSLVRVLQDYEPAPAPVQLTYPHAALLPHRVRYLIDWLTPQLAPQLTAA